MPGNIRRPTSESKHFAREIRQRAWRRCRSRHFPYVKARRTSLAEGSVAPRSSSATGGAPIPKNLRGGQNRWQSAPTILVAPYYGADPSSTRGGWPAPFVERIRRAEYPQYIWDILPIGPSEIESILRLDQIMPVGADSANWRIEPYVLGEEARELVDQWLSWLITGNLSDASALGYARTELAKP
jgi:hypothetical protein